VFDLLLDAWLIVGIQLGAIGMVTLTAHAVIVLFAWPVWSAEHREIRETAAI
jgi:hypothetical protein